MTSNSSHLSPTPPAAPEPKAKKLDLSLSQTLGGALAAMTAATIGSRLGVAGTIVGAALASIVAGVGTTLYTASLRTTRAKVQTVWSTRVAQPGTPASAAATSQPVTTAVDAPAGESTGSTAAAAPRSSRQLPWKRMLVGTLAAFAIAAVALTGFELLSGSALSGGKGTTFQQVTENGKASKPKKASASDSATPTNSASQKESASPTTATDTPSSSPSATASESPTESPSAEASTPTLAVSAPANPSSAETPVH